MIELTHENVAQLRQRFYDFYDAVVCEVAIRLRGEAPTCQVTIQSQDREASSGWSTIIFEVEFPSQLRFELGRTTFEVLSSGIQFGWKDESVYLVLDAYPDTGGELPDLSTNTAYVAGSKCRWDAQPIA